MSRLRVAHSAVSDLDEVWTYIAKRESVDAAERLVEFLTKRFALWHSIPALGGSVTTCVQGFGVYQSAVTASTIGRKKKAWSESCTCGMRRETRKR